MRQIQEQIVPRWGRGTVCPRNKEEKRRWENGGENQEVSQLKGKGILDNHVAEEKIA
jgi:hypothetical protein